MTNPNLHDASGWQVYLIARGRNRGVGSSSSEPTRVEEGVAIYGGDLVRFTHQEIVGQLIARGEKEEEEVVDEEVGARMLQMLMSMMMMVMMMMMIGMYMMMPSCL